MKVAGFMTGNYRKPYYDWLNDCISDKNVQRPVIIRHSVILTKLHYQCTLKQLLTCCVSQTAEMMSPMVVPQTP